MKFRRPRFTSCAQYSESCTVLRCWRDTVTMGMASTRYDPSGISRTRYDGQSSHTYAMSTPSTRQSFPERCLNLPVSHLTHTRSSREGCGFTVVKISSVSCVLPGACCHPASHSHTSQQGGLASHFTWWELQSRYQRIYQYFGILVVHKLRGNIILECCLPPISL